jgi:histone acetyltransferase (RNA polymerase elongator complex component)
MKPFIIPIFLPHLGCGERCIFCNQKAVAPAVPSPDEVQALVEASLRRIPSGRDRERQVAFYGGSFTAIPKEDQRAYLRDVQPFLSSRAVDSIRVSTRPDALDEEVLSLLKAYGVKTVEVGGQSMIDEVLLLSRRGHSAEEIASAVSRLKGRGFEVGLHLMIGLPGDSFDRFLETLDRVIKLGPDFVRIHPTLILRGSPLEALWQKGKYIPLTLKESILWLKGGLLKLEKERVSVARIGLQPTKDLESCYLAGPYHPSLHQIVTSEIFFDMAVHLFKTHRIDSESVFFCHPRDVSNVRGQRNTNIKRLKEVFGVKSILIHEREDIPRGLLVLQTPTGEMLAPRKE